MNMIKRDVCHSSDGSDDCMSDDGTRGGYCQTSMASSSSSINPGRKRRRGIIEKRRRDRINQSLSELKRLVPAALEKSNSAKLEKAEILQMTVEHLKSVHNSRPYSSDPYSNPDAHRIAVDYHLVGFKECAAEVARYMSATEGMEIPEQARVRLITHLQMFATQKESYGRCSTGGSYGQQAWASPYAYPGYDNTDPNKNQVEGGYFKPIEYQHQHYGFAASSTAAGLAPSASSASTTTTMAGNYFSPSAPTAVASFPVSSPPQVTSTTSYASYSSQGGGSKQPYRPWGAEMASSC